MKRHCPYPSQRSLVTFLKINSWKERMEGMVTCKYMEPNPKIPLGYFLQTQWVWFEELLNRLVSTGEGWNAD